MNIGRIVPLAIAFLLLCAVPVFYLGGLFDRWAWGQFGTLFFSPLSAVIPVVVPLCLACFAHSPQALLKAIGLAVGTGTEKANPSDLRRSAAVFDILFKTSILAGITGTVINYVFVLQSLEDPKKIGVAFGACLLTALYGLTFACFICLPCRERLRQLATEQ